ATDGKPPIEKYFAEALDHHRREGFLHLKLMTPRSYDYERIRNWDERARMPQFKFARTHKLPDESDEAYRARASKEEAEGREAVIDKLEGVDQDFIKDDSNYGADNRSPEDNAWVGLPQPRPDRLRLREMYPEVQEDEGKKYVILRLTEALRFHTLQGEPHDLP